MRIGIYSLPFHSNYGGVLQSYALQIVLQKEGHEVFVLNKNWLDYPGKRDKIEKTLCTLVSFLTFRRLYSKREKKIESIRELKRFWSTNINNLVDFREFSQIKSLELDAIVVGSDQIWRKGYCLDTRWYFLDFTELWNIKRVAYAASFGVSDWQFPEDVTNDMKNLAHNFNGISVRESDGIRLCKEYLNVDATFVLDPTLLLTSTDYEKFRSHKKDKKNKHLVSFMLHPNVEKQMLVDEIAASLDAKVINMDIPLDGGKRDRINYYKSIEQWLTEFLDADYVLTDSYHGVVFSINFNKPFVTLGNVQGGQSRFTSLLGLFSLTRRIATDKDSILCILKESINWSNVNLILENKRKKSIEFLSKSIN